MDYVTIPQLDPYPLAQIGDADLFEIAFWNGTTFVSRKVTGAVIKASVSVLVEWGDIGGNIASQTDLMNILATLAPLTSPQFTEKVGIGVAPSHPLHLRGTAIPSVNETLQRFEVADAPNAYFAIINGSTGDGIFIPKIVGRQSATNNGIAINYAGVIDEDQDSGSSAVVEFQAHLNTLQPVATRPLFRWRNWLTTYMQMNANGNLGIGTIAPLYKLHVNGTAFAKEMTISEKAIFPALVAMNSASSQWSKTLAAPVTLNNGDVANGISFFVEADKVINGTTAYNEYFLASSRNLTLTGTSGTANINVGGIDYGVTFGVSLGATASAFVTNHAANILAASGIRVAAQAGVLKFGFENQTTLNAITITNTGGNLSGTFGATGITHITIPYLGKPYEGQRLNHTMRVNFNIATGTIQTYELQLRRWADDSVIGSSIAIYRNPDVTGQQQVFETYTAGATDAFVSGGFYFALVNNSGQAVDFVGNSGILIQTTYQKPVSF